MESQKHVNQKRAGTRNFWADFLKDESGQGSVEYVVLLSVLIGIIFSVGIALRDRLVELLERVIGFRLSEQFFSPENMYRFQFNPPK